MRDPWIDYLAALCVGGVCGIRMHIVYRCFPKTHYQCARHLRSPGLETNRETVICPTSFSFLSFPYHEMVCSLSCNPPWPMLPRILAMSLTKHSVPTLSGNTSQAICQFYDSQLWLPLRISGETCFHLLWNAPPSTSRAVTVHAEGTLVLLRTAHTSMIKLSFQRIRYIGLII